MPRPTYSVDTGLLPYATPTQAKYIEAVNAHGSLRKAAKAMGVGYRVVHGCIAAVKRVAAYRGYSPDHDMTKTVPDPFNVKGVSSYFNKDGKLAGQWVKSYVDADKREALVREVIATLTEDVRGLAPLTEPPEFVHSDLLAVYPLGDPHFGMYAWAKETGEDFDLAIARRLTLGAVDRLVQTAPPAETAIVLPLGDVFHMNDQTNTTPGHKHQLDADGRFPKVLRVGIETFRHAILRCLEKHQRVIVRFVGGNHDPQAVWALALTVSAYFHDEPRVEVDLSPAAHWFYRFGKVLIGATHGDKTRHADLLGVMACDRAADWGQTRHRYFYTGHVHSQVVTEHPGLLCESFRTLAAKDAYAAGHGYRAGRDMRLIVHHIEHGEVERHRVDVGMIE